MTHADDLAQDTLAVILAGGNGSRLEPLTRAVCKPALPFGADFRSIDFSLANCRNSGIRAIGVPTQYKPDALLQHLATAWSAATGGVPHVAPWRSEERTRGRGYHGTADAVYRNLELIEQHGHSLVLVLAGDHVYQMDYRPMLALHRAREAAVTIGCVEVTPEEARHFGVLSLGSDQRIEGFIEKPQTLAELPGGGQSPVLASMGIYVFDADFLVRILKLDAATPESRHDFGSDVLPRLIRNVKAVAYPFRTADGARPAYWRDIGTLGAYWRAHMELLGPAPELRLDDTAWPLRTGAPVHAPEARRTTTMLGGTVDNSLLAGDCSIAGTVEHCVVSRGVEIGRNAAVSHAVILPGAMIGAGCRLRGVIVDAGCRVPDGTVIEQSVPHAICCEAFEPIVLGPAGPVSIGRRALG
jgi:glucose-1-phosphate adenylyltransferase